MGEGGGLAGFKPGPCPVLGSAPADPAAKSVQHNNERRAFFRVFIICPREDEARLPPVWSRLGNGLVRPERQK